MRTLQNKRNKRSLAEIEQRDSLDQQVKKRILSEKTRILWYFFYIWKYCLKDKNCLPRVIFP